MELSPTRHWSVERHIRRKHAGVGEPISINTHQSRTQMNMQSGWSNFRAPVNTMQFSHEINQLQRDSSSFLSQPTKKGSIIDDETLQLLHQMVEIKKFSGQNQLSSDLSLNMEDIKRFIGMQLPNELVAASLIHKNIVNNNRNIGYRGRICYKCLTYWIDFVHNNNEEGMKSLTLKKSSGHECDPKKVLEISKYNLLDLVSKNDQVYRGLSDLFTIIASAIIFLGQKPLHLCVEEITEDDRKLFPWIKEDCIDLGNVREIKESHWANRAINQEKVGNKKSMTISANELIDFFRTALASFGTFKVQMGEDDLPHYFLIYFDIYN